MRNVFRAIGIGTIAVALLDATDGVVFFGLTLHFNPVQVLQYIASGAFGRSASTGGRDRVRRPGHPLRSRGRVHGDLRRRVSGDSGGAPIHGGERPRVRRGRVAVYEPAGAAA